jgi:hypothetical protein
MTGWAEQYPMATIEQAQTSLLKAYHDLQEGTISEADFAAVQLYLTQAMKRIKQLNYVQAVGNKKSRLLSEAAKLSLRSNAEILPRSISAAGKASSRRPRPA